MYSRQDPQSSKKIHAHTQNRPTVTLARTGGETGKPLSPREEKTPMKIRNPCMGGQGGLPGASAVLSSSERRMLCVVYHMWELRKWVNLHFGWWLQEPGKGRGMGENSRMGGGITGSKLESNRSSRCWSSTEPNGTATVPSNELYSV